MRGRTLRSLVYELHGEGAWEVSVLRHELTAQGLDLEGLVARNMRKEGLIMNAPILNTCSVALVFANEQLLRRNNIRAKLAARGFVVRKEISSDARTFSFRSADLVIVIADNIAPGAGKLIKQAADHERVEVVFLPHQTSRPEWEALDRFVPAALLPSVPALRTAEADSDREELLRLYEAERDKARDALRTAEEERDAACEGQRRLTAEIADARGKLRATEAGAVRAKSEQEERHRRDGEERDKQVELLAGQNTRLTVERDASRDQAAKHARERAQLIADRDAARRKLVEMAAEMATAGGSTRDDLALGRLRAELASVRAESDVAIRNAETLRAEVNRLTEDRDEQLNRYNMSHAREAQRQAQLAESRAALEELRKAGKQAVDETQIVKELRTAKKSLEHRIGHIERRAEAAEARIAELLAEAPKDGGGVAEIARMIAGLVTAGVLSESEAYTKLAAACGKVGRS